MPERYKASRIEAYLLGIFPLRVRQFLPAVNISLYRWVQNELLSYRVSS